MQTTALINELYLKMVDLKRVNWQNRAHFYALCARQMRRILTDLYRAGVCQKRGGNQELVVLDVSTICASEPRRDLMAIDEAWSGWRRWMHARAKWWNCDSLAA